MSKQVNFKSKARLMPQLGDQLIKNENIAILELIKNSYDADAKSVKVIMNDVDKPEQGEIIIWDTGRGMDADTIENTWMEIGTDNKKQELEELLAKKQKSELKRYPMGEKGIGRFGVHKLGHKIYLVSRAYNEKEVVVNIDWRIFDEYEYLEQVPITIEERDPEVFTNDSTGTYIKITKLKSSWNRGKLRELKRSILSLNSPFESIQSFSIDFQTSHKDWVDKMLEFDDIKKSALYFADVEIKDDVITSFVYNFEPWAVLNKLNSRKEIKSNIPMVREVRKEGKKVQEFIDLSRYKIGTVKLKLIIFDLDSKVLSYGVSDVKGLKEYLKYNGGISVYRDNIRIYEYGDAGNDWLQLESKRINAPGVVLSSKIVIGAVYLERMDSFDLIEKTNREGLVENVAFEEFRDAVLFAIEKVQTQRNIDKKDIKFYYGPSNKTEPVVSRISDLRVLVDKNIEDVKLKNQINTSLNLIEDDYKSIVDIYIRSASAGLSIGVVIHEIEKIISELGKAITVESTSEHVKILISDLTRLTDGYASVIKNKRKINAEPEDIIEAAIFNVKYRLKVHEVEVVDGYSNISINKIYCAENLILGTIMNIVDNSIWWLTYYKVKNKKIYFGLSLDFEGYVTIVIADNGSGFTLPKEDMVRPFISDKPGGMGLGLHLASEIMKAHSGQLIFPEIGEVELPNEFKNGAVVCLAFPVAKKKDI